MDSRIREFGFPPESDLKKGFAYGIHRFAIRCESSFRRIRKNANNANPEFKWIGESKTLGIWIRKMQLQSISRLNMDSRILMPTSPCLLGFTILRICILAFKGISARNQGTFFSSCAKESYSKVHKWKIMKTLKKPLNHVNVARLIKNFTFFF